jgi:hypothetical protein
VPRKPIGKRTRVAIANGVERITHAGQITVSQEERAGRWERAVPDVNRISRLLLLIFFPIGLTQISIAAGVLKDEPGTVTFLPSQPSLLSDQQTIPTPKCTMASVAAAVSLRATSASMFW